MAPNSVLYPLQFLGFEFMTLVSWHELPGKLLELHDDLLGRHATVRN